MEDYAVINQEYRDKLIGQKITDVNLYFVNEVLFDNRDCDRQFMDGGVEILFENEGVLTFGWDAHNELQKTSFTNFKSHYEDDNAYVIDNSNDIYWKKVIGSTITDIKITWNWYMDDDSTTQNIPVLICFALDNGVKFIVCSMEFDINNDKIENLVLDSQGHIVAHFDEPTIIELLHEDAF